jgi:hypothetical protein
LWPVKLTLPTGLVNDRPENCSAKIEMSCPLPKVRHEVASITVNSAHAGLHPLFHSRFLIQLFGGKFGPTHVTTKASSKGVPQPPF